LEGRKKIPNRGSTKRRKRENVDFFDIRERHPIQRATVLSRHDLTGQKESNRRRKNGFCGRRRTCCGSVSRKNPTTFFRVAKGQFSKETSSQNKRGVVLGKDGNWIQEEAFFFEARLKCAIPQCLKAAAINYGSTGGGKVSKGLSRRGV